MHPLFLSSGRVNPAGKQAGIPRPHASACRAQQRNFLQSSGLPLNGPRQGLNEEQRKPGLRPRNYKGGLGAVAPALQTPVHLIMIISVFVLHRQRRLLKR